MPDDELDPETGADRDHDVPAELVEIHEASEYLAAVDDEGQP